MQTWSRLWHRITTRPVRQAWGLAVHGPSWHLVGLSMQTPGLVRVHTTMQWPTAPGEPQVSGMSARLREVSTARGPSRQRVSMALAADQLVSGVLEFPLRMPREDWVSEVQLEVSQMLGQEPDEVHFDFAPEPQSDGLVQRVHWVGCNRTAIAEFKSCTRAAGWLLDSVEPAEQAALRASAALQGGLPSLLTQPTQDWQFHWTESKDATHLSRARSLAFTTDHALQQAMKSDAGARLVACGLALKAWL